MPGSEREIKIRHYVLAGLLAAFVSLCTVAGEALVPQVFPPHDFEEWLAFLAAVTLFTVTFGVTTIIAGFLDRIAAAIPRRPFRGVSRERMRKIGMAALFFATLALVIGNLQVNPAGGEPRWVVSKDGLSQQQYCERAGYKYVGGDYCLLPVSLDRACENAHPKEGRLAARLAEPTDAQTANCYDGKRNVGDIGNMGEYCKKAITPADNRSEYYIDPTKDKTADAKNAWKCREKIDRDAVCQGTLRRSEARAFRLDPDGDRYGCRYPEEPAT
ncbi:hypothetical protein [Actinocorallia longicatena]|uniref:Uncharacterized protein n=1 Tax=Actinocorallia longicatena TaxID=111803 RepID=A0ABP6QDY7_9ACTN